MTEQRNSSSTAGSPSNLDRRRDKMQSTKAASAQVAVNAERHAGRETDLQATLEHPHSDQHRRGLWRRRTRPVIPGMNASQATTASIDDRATGDLRLRTIGIEEDFLLVDRAYGRTVAVGGTVLRTGEHEAVDSPDLRGEQIETGTRTCLELAELSREVRRCRHRVSDAAATVGADIAPLATSPQWADPTAAAGHRRRMIDAFGLSGGEHMTCGSRMHVGVGSEDEAVAVLDRIRVWLAPLLALSANSPYWQGTDTGYASYRSQICSRRPTAGPTEPFGTPAGYRAAVRAILETDSALDEGMLFFDARMSRTHPTVEIRVPDVCRDPDDTVLIAALVRGLVTTAADQWRAGRAPDPVGTGVLRLAAWRAGRSGLDDLLLDPRTWSLSPASDVVARLVDHISPALEETGDLPLVRELVHGVLRRGTGAARQRQVMMRTGDLDAVVSDAVASSRHEPATPVALWSRSIT